MQDAPVSERLDASERALLDDLHAVWERFVTRGELAEGIRPLVREAWARSAKLGVEPRNVRRQRYDPERAGAAKARSAKLLAAARPFLEAAHQSLGARPHLIALLDERAIVLELSTNHGDAEARAGVNLFEGASWAEKDIGCNGGGSALALERPVLFLGPEHFNEGFLGWTCIGAPIRSPDGRIAGALDFSVPNGAMHLAAWGWLREITAAIEAQLALEGPPDPAVVERVTDDLGNPFHVVRGVLDLVGSQLGILPTHRRLLAEARGTVDHAQRLLEHSLAELADVHQQLERANEELRLASVKARQRAEDALAASSEAGRRARELTGLLESLSDAVVIVDSRGVVLLQNAASRDLADGLDLQGRPLVSAPMGRLGLDGTPLPLELWPVSRLLAGERVVDMEQLLAYADGRRRHVVSCGSVVRDESGAVVLGILVTRDLSELRRMELLREDFMRIAAHDMRQPLSTVVTGAEVLVRALRARGLEREASQADRIRGGGQRIAAMIDELLDAARLEAGTHRLEKELVDLRSLAREVIDDLRPTAGGERLEASLGDRRALVLGDRSALERIVENLVGNALKYGGTDGPVLVRVEAGAAVVALSVSDRGPGMSAEELGHVFQRYYRARSVGRQEGLGLGLYITRLLVEAHGGRVEVRSRPGEETTFEVRLPAAP